MCEFFLYDQTNTHKCYVPNGFPFGCVADWSLRSNYRQFLSYWGWYPYQAHGHDPRTITLQIDHILEYYEDKLEISRDEPNQNPSDYLNDITAEWFYYHMRRLWDTCQSLIIEYNGADHIFFWCDHHVLGFYEGIPAHNFSQDLPTLEDEAKIAYIRQH